MVTDVPFIVLALILFCYAGVLVWFRLNEDRIIFEAHREPVEPPDPALGLESCDVQFMGKAGRLTARVIPPPPQVSEEEAGWMLYLHGSSGSIGLPEYNAAWAEFRRSGFGLMAVDYRGFGASEGTISEEGIYQDAQSAYEYLRRELKIPQERILLYGFSMGAAVAIDLATRVEAAGLIVEGAWRSVPHLGRERYPWLPVSLVAKNRFDSETKVSSVEIPKIFVHAVDDEVIPVAHSRKLCDLAVEPKEFHELGGTHGTSHTTDPSFFTKVGDFVERLGLPVLPRPESGTGSAGRES